MDPEANKREQGRIAGRILSICDDCDSDGSLSPDQLETVAEEAYRLAELVEALRQWERMHKQ